MVSLQRSLEGGTVVKVTFAYKIRSKAFNASPLEEPHKPYPLPTSHFPLCGFECLTSFLFGVCLSSHSQDAESRNPLEI